MGELSEREQDVLKARYGFEDGVEKTLEEVGQTFGITRERIRHYQDLPLILMTICYRFYITATTRRLPMRFWTIFSQRRRGRSVGMRQ